LGFQKKILHKIYLHTINRENMQIIIYKMGYK
jgi:hypothetical protein